MVDKTTPKSTEKNTQKSSDELFLRGADDDILRKKADEENLKLNDSQEEVFLQNIQRGSEQAIATDRSDVNDIDTAEVAGSSIDQGVVINAEKAEIKSERDDVEVISNKTINTEEVNQSSKLDANKLSSNTQNLDKTLINQDTAVSGDAVKQSSFDTADAIQYTNEKVFLSSDETTETANSVNENYNTAPDAGDNVVLEVVEGKPVIEGQLLATDIDAGDILSYKVIEGIKLPDGFSLSENGEWKFDAQVESYDHLNTGDAVVMTIPVVVTDERGAIDTVQIQVTVNGTNNAPIAGYSVSSDVGENALEINGQLSATDVDDSAVLSWGIAEGSVIPDGFTINSDGSYSFDPTNEGYDNLNVGDSLTITIPVTVTDENGAADNSQIQITVSGTNDVPVAGASVIVNTDESTSTINGQFTSSDQDDFASANWSVSDSSSSPDGFVLNTDGSYSFDPTDSTYEHLNVGDSEVITIPVTITDENGATDTSQIQITISGTNDGPVAGAAVIANIDEQSSVINSQLTSTDLDDGATSSWSVSAGGSEPVGFVLNVDGSYSFDPADSAYQHLNVGDSEIVTIPVTVTDDNGATDTTQIQITVSGTNDAPVAGASVTANIDESSASISGQLTATDVDDGATAVFTISEGSSAPDGFVLNTDGSYSFDPTDGTYDGLNVGDSAVLTIPVTITDDNGATDTSQIQITVSGTNDAPVAGADVTSSVSEGASIISGQLTSTDLDDGATATFTVSDGSATPDGFVLNTDGSYSFDPTDSTYDNLNVGDSAVLTIPVTVTDDNGATDTSQIQITISGTNDAPVAGADVMSSVSEGASMISGQLSSSDIDDNAMATFTVSPGLSSPDGFILNTDGSYIFNPDNITYNHLNAGDETVLTIPVTVTDDNGATDTAQIQITVTGTNDAPVAGANITTNVDEGASSISGQLTATDVDANATATFTISDGATAPDGFVLNTDGSYFFDPTDSTYDSLNVGDSAVLTIPITVTDDNGSVDTAQIQITVSGTNDAPVAGADVTTSVTEGAEAIGGQLIASDIDADSSVSFSLADGETAPAGFSVNTDGSYSFNPSDEAYQNLAVGESQQLNITITATDDQGATDNSQIQIIVSGSNAGPVAQVDEIEAFDEDHSITISASSLLSNDTDVDGDTLTISSVQDASHGSVILNDDGSVTFTPDENYFGEAQFSYTASDGNGEFSSATVNLTVDSVNDAPVIDVVAFETSEDSTVIIATASDIDGEISLSDSSAAHGSLAMDEDGNITYTPDANYNGTDVVSVSVIDNDGSTESRTINLTIDPANDAPVIVEDVATTVDEGVGITGQLSSSDVDEGATATFAVSDGVTAPDGFVLNADGSYSFDSGDSTYDHLGVGDSTVLTIPVTVTDDNGATDTAQIQITVSGTNDGPVAGENVSSSVNEDGVSINGQLTASDIDDGASVSFSIADGVDTPAGFSIDVDGSYSFDPADNAYGHLNVGDSAVLTIPVTVTDDNGATDTSQIQITISGTNDAPVAGADVTASVDEGVSNISGQLTSTDLDDGATVTFAVSDGSVAPDGFVINTDGSYSFDPTDSTYDNLNVGDSTVFTIPVTVTDDNGATDTSQIQITVSGTNDAPVAGASITTNVDEGASSISGQLTATDVDDNATAIFTISDGTTAPDGFILNEDGSYDFNPENAAYDDLNVGDSTVLTIPITVTDDNGATDTSQIQITVSGTNDSPVAGAGITASVSEGESIISGQLTSTDLDDGATAVFTISEGSNTPDGFVLNTDGSYSFDPSDSTYDNLNVGDSAVLTIPVTVTDDNGATDTSQIQITISGTNDAPVAGANITTNVDEGDSSISGQLTSTDLDDGAIATFTVSAGSATPDGFVLNTDGSYSFDPTDSTYDNLNVGDSAVLTIPVIVTDDNGATDTSQIQITVSGTNDAPVAGADITASVDEGTSIINGQLTSTDLDDGATATFTVSDGVTTPDGFVLNTDGSYSFDPTDSTYDNLGVGDSAVLTIPVTVTDDNGATDTSQIQITVSGTNDAPVAGASVIADVDEGASSISGQLTSTDLDNGTTATFTVTEGSSAPDGFVLNTDGSYSFDPSVSTYDNLNVGDSAVLTIPVTVTDDNGATDTSQIQITISGTNDAPVAGADVTASVDEGDSIISGQLTSTDLDDGATAVFTISEGSNTPDGFVLNTDGSYSFDPTDSTYDSLNVGDSTVLTIPVTVTDDNGATDTSQIQITISGTNDAPVAGANISTNVDEGASSISGQLTSTDLDDGATATFTVSDGSATPDGFVLNTDGSYSFDPSDSTYDNLNVGDSAVLTIPVTVTDDNGATDTSQIQITISGSNDSPTAISVVSTGVDENVSAGTVVATLSASDVDAGETFTYTLNDDSGLFAISGNQVIVQEGADIDFESDETHDISVQVTDSNGATYTESFNIQVNDIYENDTVSASDESYSTYDTQDATVTGALGANDAVDVYTFTHNGGPLILDALTETSETDVWSNLSDSGNENYVEISGDESKDAFDITLTLKDANGSSVAFNDDGDYDGNYAGNADFGYGDGSVNGLDSYIDINDLPAGTYTIEVRSYNASSSGPYTISITGDMSLEANPFETDENEPLLIDPTLLLANDVDSDGDSLSITGIESVEHGTAIMNADGNIVFTPEAGYTGEANFVYSISDGNGGLDTATVTLSVNEVIIPGENLSYVDVENSYSSSDYREATLTTGDGNDTIAISGQVNDDRTINTNDGNDTITIGDDLQGASTINTGSGDDVITLGDDLKEGSIINAGSGDDTIRVNDDMYDNSEINAGSGNDDITVSGTLSGTASINSGDGDDTVSIGRIESNATIDTGSGNDNVTLEDVSSSFDGGSVNLGEGSDTLTINDSLLGSNADYDGGNGDDSLILNNVSQSSWENGVSDHFSNFENVTFSDGSAIDLSDGSSLNVLSGSGSDNNISGTSGDDLIRGEAGNDQINGGAGDDHIYGGSGDDTLTGGAGDDNAYGGAGNDTYEMNPLDGSDFFSGGEGGGWTDAIDISAMAANDPENPWTIEVDGTQVEYDLAAGALEMNGDTAGVITFGDGSELSFEGVEQIQW